MKKLILWTAALLTSSALWSTTSFANLPPERSASQMEEIHQYAQYFAKYYPELKVEPRMSAENQASDVLTQMQQLETYLQDESQAPLTAGQLNLLACLKCVCIGCAGGESQ